MDMKELTAWVEAHPGESVIIGGGGLLLLLWLLGFFSSSTQTTTQDPLAAAYYAAEAQQAVVGGQIQMNNADNVAATAQAGINANAATTIAATNANAAQTINGQNVGAAQTIAGTQAGVYTSLGSDQLQATQINANAATSISANNNATFVQANQASIYGQEALATINNVIPYELSHFSSAIVSVPGVGQIGAQPWSPPSPAAWQAAGFPPAESVALGEWQLAGQNPADIGLGGPLSGVPQSSGG